MTSICANVVADEAVVPKDKSANNATHAIPASMLLGSFTFPPNQFDGPELTQIRAQP
jgi:hypothetical protein